jgi:hypothetical protein
MYISPAYSNMSEQIFGALAGFTLNTREIINMYKIMIIQPLVKGMNHTPDSGTAGSYY